MKIFTKAMTLTAMAAVMSFTADAAPVKRALQPEEGLGYTSVVKRVMPDDPDAETWHDIGEGILRDDVMTTFYIIDCVEFPVTIRESDQTPGRYCLINAWSKYPLWANLFPANNTYPKDRIVPIIIDASDPDHVFIAPPGFMGAYTEEAVAGGDGYQEGVLYSMGGDFNQDNLNHFTREEYDRICGRLRDGAITFPINTLLYQGWEQSSIDNEGNPIVGSLWRMVNNSGMFRVKLPGAPNIDVNIVYLETLSDDKKSVQYELTLQEDIAKLRCALVEGDEEIVPEAAEKIKNGEIEYVEVTGSGRYDIPFPGNGKYTLVCVPYTDDDVARYESYLTRTFTFDDDEWISRGTARFKEGILSDNQLRDWGFIVSPQEMDVQVQSNVANPQLFRIVNAYAPPYSYANEQNYDFTEPYYIEFDASDCNRVFVNQTEAGIGINMGYGTMRVWSKANRLMTFEDMTLDEVSKWERSDDPLAMPVFGSIDSNNVLTFPNNALLINFAKARPDTWYWANCTGTFRLTLPKEMQFVSTVLDIESDTNAPIEWYTLGGVKVSGENMLPGIYVVRQGSKVWKETVK